MLNCGSLIQNWQAARHFTLKLGMRFKLWTIPSRLVCSRSAKVNYLLLLKIHKNPFKQD